MIFDCEECEHQIKYLEDFHTCNICGRTVEKLEELSIKHWEEYDEIYRLDISEDL